MHRPWFLFILLMAMCVLVGALFLVEERPSEDRYEGGAVQRVYLGHGSPHAEFPTMQQGGNGAARHQHLQWLGWALGTIMVVFSVSCLALGAAKHGKAGPTRRPLLVGAVLYALIIAAIFVTYQRYIAGEVQPLVLGHPISSALLLAGIWAFPLFFALVFFLNFDRWYVTPADAERFRELVGQRKRDER